MQRVYLITWYKHNYFNTMLFLKINKLLVLPMTMRRHTKIGRHQ